jgi:RimJ/RimL family protein N-acetyltransferase/uncharacterized protein YndB with AHSA1/START domain
MSETFRTAIDIDASPDQVFDYFTRPELLVHWMGDVARLEASAGGVFSVDINGVAIRGHFVRLERPRLIEIAWGEAGNAVMPPGATRLMVTLTAHAGRTRVTLEHSGLAPVEAKKHAIGWPHFIERLAIAARGEEPGPDPWRELARPPAPAKGMPTLQTARLALRPLRDDDLDAFASMHADPRFMQYLSTPLSRLESAGALARLRRSYDDVRFGPWGVEVLDGPGLIGVVGLSRSHLEVPFAPCVEIVWRLAPEHWGRGYATEAARAALDYGFAVLGLSEILSWTTPANQASRRVMEKLGMTRDPSEDFDHPRLPIGHPLRRHVLYRARRGR